MKRFIFLVLVMTTLFALSACSSEKLKTEKLRDIEFTVVDEADIPEEFMEVIEEKEKKPFKRTYADQGYLYIAEGYGKQDTSGYSIEVVSLYETENAIYIQTNLIGPANDEEIVERATYPYVVIKMEDVDKNVVFQ